jgi:hypothetical protein
MATRKKPTRITLGKGRQLIAEWSMDTGIAEFTEVTGDDVRAKIHSPAGSFEEIARQMRDVVEHAEEQGWITKDKARHTRTLISKTLVRQKELLRSQRVL